VAGGGVEWALPVNWFGSSAVTFGLEGLWLSFDDDDDFGGGVVGSFQPAAGGPAIDVVAPPGGSDDNDFFVARAKLNFKFGTY
jgi:outer membrane immunogenic protein